MFTFPSDREIVTTCIFDGRWAWLICATAQVRFGFSMVRQEGYPKHYLYV
jgi:hypothetical protein